MSHVILFLVGLAAGSIIVFLLLLERLRKVRSQKAQQDMQEQRLREGAKRVAARLSDVDTREQQLALAQEEFNRRAISYKELQDENLILKRDLQNIDVNLWKLELDGRVRREAQDVLDAKSSALAAQYLKDNIKWIATSLTPNNFVACKQRLVDAILRCRDVGYEIPVDNEKQYVEDLKTNFEKIVRAAFEREEQARIKAQIREEQQLEREVERELKQLERERAAITAALEKALAEAKDQHSDEVDRLKARLAEAEAKSQRAMSQAQMTKSGHVYVISNIGSFGRDVFKVGMTRRLEPADRVRELSSASVPFPFDVHMMISCDDAPKLENALHRALHKSRLNRVNPRKEFFKSDIEEVRRIVEANHGEVQYVADAEALEFNQSLSASEEDSEYIDQVFASIAGDGEQAEE